MQEHDAVLVLDRVEVHVGAAVDLGRQRRQFEIVRGEEREAAILFGEAVRDRPCQRETVERRRAAADLVDQNEALRRCAIQDVRCFGHLDHERRATACEIVGGADPRVNRIERSDCRAFCRHEAPAASEQRDHRRLPHVR